MVQLTKKLLAIAVVILMTVGISSADTKVSIPEIKYQQFKLDNGLRIVVLEDHQVPMVNFAVWYNVGSIDEPKGVTGMSHLLEHTMFHGTPGLAKEDSWTIIKKVGGSNNAGTFYDYTVYYEDVPSAKLELAVAFEADRMRNLKFDDAEFLRERDVVMQERRQSLESNFFRSAMEELQSVSFVEHGLHHQIIGWMKDLEVMKMEDLQKYYTQYYAPNNAVVVIAGDVKAKDGYELVKKYFGNYQPQEITRLVRTEPPQTEERFKRIQKITSVPILMMQYRGLPGNHKDQVALQTLLTILINDPNSRINQKLKNEQQTIMQAFAYSLGLRDDGLMLLGMIGNAAKGGDKTEDQSLTEIKAAFDAELKNLIENGITDIELQKVKKSVIKSMIYAKKNTENNARMIAESYVRFNEPDQYKKELEWFNELTKEDIIAVAQKYLVPTQRTVGYLVNNPPVVEEKKEDSKKQTQKKGK